ncbi:MAG TPA: hypothetical protein VNK04_25625 [Gemmataceae bacterium]|nr:hypothetical protein [Gemmataceae bacterium]
MRYMAIALGLTAALLPTACNNFRNHPPPEQVRGFDRTPTAEQLVRHLNHNAQRVQGVEYQRAWIDVKQGNDTVMLESLLACQKPRNFRLIGRAVGNREVDIGSNDQEFWYWIKRAPEPNYVYYCSHEDFRRGVRLPFPFQPEWVMEALGVASYDETKKYEVRETPRTVELIERTTTPQGQPVRKVTVFDRGQLATGRVQPAGYVLQDASGREIASAKVADIQYDPATGAVLPRRVQLVWPAEKIEMTMKLEGPRVGPIDPQRAAGIFSRRDLASLPSYDLARGPDAASGRVERTGGLLR